MFPVSKLPQPVSTERRESRWVCDCWIQAPVDRDSAFSSEALPTCQRCTLAKIVQHVGLLEMKVSSLLQCIGRARSLHLFDCLLHWSHRVEVLWHEVVRNCLQVLSNSFSFFQRTLRPLQGHLVLGMVLEVRFQLFGLQGLQLELPSTVFSNSFSVETSGDVSDAVPEELHISHLQRQRVQRTESVGRCLRVHDCPQFLLLLMCSHGESCAAGTSPCATPHAVCVVSHRNRHIGIDNRADAFQVHTSRDRKLFVRPSSHTLLMFLLCSRRLHHHGGLLPVLLNFLFLLPVHIFCRFSLRLFPLLLLGFLGNWPGFLCNRLGLLCGRFWFTICCCVLLCLRHVISREAGPETVVGSDEQVDKILVERLDHVLTAVVGHLCIQHCGINAESLQEYFHFVCCLHRVHKHQDFGLHEFQFQKRVNNQVLVVLITPDIKLVQFPCDSGFLQFQGDRLVQHQAFEHLHLFRQGGRNQHRLVCRRHQAAKGPHILLVTKRKHEIRLVND
mmetsp:Transcript_18579/g.49918  ORF Transcript_18579/g.49918 Transcript_18579/m.49918 type:complete len:502 (-) Transcript_18579:521-2026(-)